jgi:hypothetical protein
LDKPLHVIYKVSKVAYRIRVILIATKRERERTKKKKEEEEDGIHEVPRRILRNSVAYVGV